MPIPFFAGLALGCIGVIAYNNKDKIKSKITEFIQDSEYTQKAQDLVDDAKEFAKENLDKGVKMAKQAASKLKSERPKRAKKAAKNAENSLRKTAKKATKAAKKTSPKLKKDGTPKAKPGPKPKQPQTELQA